METLRRFAYAVIVGGALALAAACGGTDGAGTVAPPGVEAPGGDADGEGAGDSDSCALLTKEEVAEAIGPHDGGQQDYTFGGCVWRASDAKDGINETIYATVLPKAQYEAVAEIGEPVSGFVDGATYDRTHGELWFPCRGGDYCGIKVGTASADGRQETALRLGEILRSRV